MAFGGMSSAAIRIVLTGQQRTIAGLAATRSQVNALTKSVAMYGAAAEESTKRSFLMNQALFTMRRYGYMATLAFTGLIGMGLKWGTQFNETMLSARLQLEKMLPGTRAVNNELQDLFN